ncbi:M48 family metalloprotease [Geitlerinema splendidum]|jgi:predicted Zn-dependent protease|nr:M48 family metalloprotease [Geitlerinema splendidum]
MLLKFLLCFIIFLWPSLSFASAPAKDALIRDAEIEDVLKSYVEPIFKVAGLDPKSLHLYIINSNEVNAFAMVGGRIAMNTGLILKANSALQVIGVFAHETAHIADKHILRGIDAYEKALWQNMLGTMLGGAVAAAAGRTDVGAAIMMGSQDMTERGLLKFSRTQEGSADQGAARFLDSLGYSSRGALEFMEILRKEDLLSEQYLDPYVLTHPLVSERVDFFRSHVSKSPHANAKLPQKFEDNFKRIQVKIAAFTQSPAKTLSQLDPTDTSLLARYGRAIAYFQSSQIPEALKEVDSLLREYPEDAFFWDLKGQILFESGKIKESLTAFEKAVHLRPDIPLLRVSLAHALIESNDPTKEEQAFGELSRARTDEGDNPFIHRLLAVYYGKSGKTGLAALSLAEMSLEVGDLKTAEQQAKRSLHFLKGDPVNETRAKDILAEINQLKDLESGLF